MHFKPCRGQQISVSLCIQASTIQYSTKLSLLRNKLSLCNQFHPEERKTIGSDASQHMLLTLYKLCAGKSRVCSKIEAHGQ